MATDTAVVERGTCLAAFLLLPRRCTADEEVVDACCRNSDACQRRSGALEPSHAASASTDGVVLAARFADVEFGCSTPRGWTPRNPHSALPGASCSPTPVEEGVAQRGEDGSRRSRAPAGSRRWMCRRRAGAGTGLARHGGAAAGRPPPTTPPRRPTPGRRCAGGGAVNRRVFCARTTCPSSW